MGDNTVASLPGTLHARCLSMFHGYWRCPEPTQCHHDVRATTAYGCLPIRVHMVATTADATLAQRHKGTGDTREKSLHIPLWQEGQVALGRRAVGAVFSVEMRLLRSARPEKAIFRAFSGGGVVENSRNFPKKHHQVATLS